MLHEWRSEQIDTAYPRELVRTVADVFRLPEATVALHDRALAEHGYRRSGGRGRSAAKVTPDDAANLIIAIAAAPMSGPAIRNTVETYRQYAGLRAGYKNFAKQADWSPLLVLRELTIGHSLAAAVSGLISAYANQQFEQPNQVS